METKKLKKISLLFVAFNLGIIFVCHAQSGLVNSANWLTIGNTTSWSGAITCPYSYIGTKNCAELRIIANNIEMMQFKPACSCNAGGKSSIRIYNTDTMIFDVGKSHYRYGGVPGTSSQLASITPSPLLAADVVHIFETDSTGPVKGFSFKGIGTSSTAALTVSVTSTGGVSRNGIKSTSLPKSGYGTGIIATGGQYGVKGIGSGGSYSGTNIVFGGYFTSAGVPDTFTTRYGVYGLASNAHTAFGIYGDASSTGVTDTFIRAGYFNGKVQATGYFISPASDEKLKENITPFFGALEKLKKINVLTYDYKSEFSFMNLPEGRQIGIMAQNLEKVFPQMVVASIHPANYDSETGEKISNEVSYKGINSIGLIPVLIKGVNEQQDQIEELKKENSELKDQIAEIQSTLNTLANKNSLMLENSNPMLEQNVPNPFSQKTVVRYFIPENSSDAAINIYSSDHVFLKSFQILTIGKGEISIDAGILAAGNYFYELIIDKKMIESKKMILTK